MNVSRFAVSRPVATAMFFIAVIVFGVYSFSRLPVDLFPDIDVPVLSVITTYPGVGAQEVEQNITDPLESVLGTVPNLTGITSMSQDDVSVIMLEFDWSVGLDEAANDVRDRLGRAAQFLPDDADAPFLQKFDTGAIPVLVYSATATDSWADLEELIDVYLVGPLNRISGVGDVAVTGAPVRQIQVTLDPGLLESFGLDIRQVAQAIQAENVVSAAGRVEQDDESFNLRINTEFSEVDEIEEVILISRQGRTIRVGDVGTVREGYEDEAAISRVDGRQGLTLTVQKQSDANTVEVARAVEARLPGLLTALPDDVEVELVFDTSEFIVNSVDNLSSVLFYAVLFVVLVVLIFLRQWRATVVVAATIPVSLLTAFVYLSLTGATLNLISLSSLSIALGMVVDDAIVVLENVMRHVERGSRAREAAIYGAREVGIAVFATTLTVVAVFLPLTFLSGPMGMWFGQLGAIVVVTVVTSTLAALTLTPMMASVLLKRGADRRSPFRGVAAVVERAFQGVERIYARTLRLAMRFKKSVIFVCFLVFVGSLALVPVIGTEFMPVSDDSQLRISGEVETGRSLEFTSAVVERLEEELREVVPEARLINSTSGREGGMFGAGGGRNSFQLRIQLLRVDERERTVFEIADVAREIVEGMPEIAEFDVRTGGGGGGGQGRPIQVQILGHDLEATTALAEELMDQMEGIDGVRDIATSRGRSRPEYEFVLDRERLAHFEMTSAAVASVVRGNLAGQTATRFRRDGKEYDVVLRFDEDRRRTLRQVQEMTLLSPSGHRVQLQELGELREYYGPPSIDRVDRERAVTVSAGLQGVPLNRAMAQIQSWVEEQHLPPQMEIVLTGDFEDQQEAFRDLFLVLILSIILVYLVMAAQFESLKEPFVIMFSIPFAFTGVLLALLVTDTALSVIGFVGAIILVGIVVKNAIVLIDYVKLLRQREYSVVDAIVEGSTARLRPVLMTTLTTVLAMMPLALNLGEGAEIWQPMAICVIGGLLFSTVVTLLLIPAMYGQFQWKALRAERRAAEEQAASEEGEP